jgi:succinoglycan biosynthesis transport protein ExoP
VTEPLHSFDSRRGAIRYLQAFRQHWLLILTLVVVSVGLASTYSYTATKRYDASADLLIAPLAAGDNTFAGFSLFRQTTDASSPIVTATRVLGARDIYDATYAQLQKGPSVSIALSPVSQADIITVTASSSDPHRAAEAANLFTQTALSIRTDTFQKELKLRIRQLRAQAAAVPVADRNGNFQYASLLQSLGNLDVFVGSADPTLSLLAPATPPTVASWPRPILSITVAFLASLLLGTGVAVALELLNPRMLQEEDLRLGHRLPILARIPLLTGRVARGYLTGKTVLPSEAWKGYRTLRAVLANAGSDGGYPKSILVTSATPSDGKTMTAVNLAITLAAANLRVVLVDGDFYRPMIASIFNTSLHRDGLLRLLMTGDSGKAALVPAPNHPGLSLVLSNREQMYRFSQLDTDRFKRMLEVLQKDCDVVVIDSPPLTEVAEALAMAGAVDAVLIAVRLGNTRRDQLAQLRELLARRGASPLGFVLTMHRRSRGTNHYSKYTEFEYARDTSAQVRSAGGE